MVKMFHFTVKEQREQNIFTSQQLESDNLTCFPSKKANC